MKVGFGERGPLLKNFPSWTFPRGEGSCPAFSCLKTTPDTARPWALGRCPGRFGFGDQNVVFQRSKTSVRLPEESLTAVPWGHQPFPSPLELLRSPQPSCSHPLLLSRTIRHPFGGGSGSFPTMEAFPTQVCAVMLFLAMPPTALPGQGEPSSCIGPLSPRPELGFKP